LDYGCSQGIQLLVDLKYFALFSLGLAPYSLYYTQGTCERGLLGFVV